jgi:hypothetical protein
MSKATGEVKVGREVGNAKGKLVVTVLDLKESNVTLSAEAKVPGLDGKLKPHIPLKKIEKSYTTGSLNVMGKQWIRSEKPVG